MSEPNPDPAELYQIDQALSGLRLDQGLKQLIPDHSRSQLQQWIRDGRVTVDNQPASPRHRLFGGETVAVRRPAAVTEQPPTAEPLSIDFVEVDDQILVINKPAGLVVHPGAGVRGGTLLNGLLHHFPELSTIPRAGIVHRLDKETTGLMVVARTLPAHKSLTDQLAARSVQREYLALVHGWIIAGGTVDQPVGRHPVDRKRMAVAAHGRPARSHYRVERQWPYHTLLRVSLESGRTHQIRVHMQHLRHPLVGDPVYGSRPLPPAGCDQSLRTALSNFSRQALHATRLSLTHPTTGAEMNWQRPVPEDFAHLLEQLDYAYPPESGHQASEP